MARNCPVSCKSPTEIEAGIMVSESSGSGAEVRETVIFAVADTTDVSGFVHSAVMVVVPWLTAVARPPVVMVAIWMLEELHVTLLVMSTVAPEEVVPMAMNWAVCPWEATDWEPGMILTETRSPPPVPLPPVTVTASATAVGAVKLVKRASRVNILKQM